MTSPSSESSALPNGNMLFITPEVSTTQPPPCGRSSTINIVIEDSPTGRRRVTIAASGEVASTMNVERIISASPQWGWGTLPMSLFDFDGASTVMR